MLVVHLKEWQRDSRLLYLKMPQSAFVEDVWRLLYLKLGKHCLENFFFDDLNTSEMVVVK